MKNNCNLLQIKSLQNYQILKISFGLIFKIFPMKNIQPLKISSLICPSKYQLFIYNMGRIDFTNIVIDDFSLAKKNPHNKYIHFLTHIHTDHLKGLNNSWNFGPIYCSQITKKLLLSKFPKLQCLQTLQINQPYSLNITQDLSVCVTLLPANHCRGAIMVLLEGYFGRVLYTGDIRFNKKIFEQFQHLYPPISLNKQFKDCSKPIDVLYLDNTFLDPRFTFPSQKNAMETVKDFILNQQIANKNIIVGMDNYGKEQVLEYIAELTGELILVDENRYETIISMEFDHQHFTTRPDQSRIEVVPRSLLRKKLAEKQNSIGLVLSGWSISPRTSGNVYYIPYSLHSNFSQLEEFVQSIRPSAIIPIVTNNSCTSQDIGGGDSSMYYSPQYSKHLKQLRKKFCKQPSPQYLQLLQNAEIQLKIKQKLKLDRTVQEVNRMELGLSTTFVQPPQGKGYKLNNPRDQETISHHKHLLQKRKKMFTQPIKRVPEKYVVLDDDELYNEDKNKVTELKNKDGINAIEREQIQVRIEEVTQMLDIEPNNNEQVQIQKQRVQINLLEDENLLKGATKYIIIDDQNENKFNKFLDKNAYELMNTLSQYMKSSNKKAYEQILKQKWGKNAQKEGNRDEVQQLD